MSGAIDGSTKAATSLEVDANGPTKLGSFPPRLKPATLKEDC